MEKSTGESSRFAQLPQMLSGAAGSLQDLVSQVQGLADVKRGTFCGAEGGNHDGSGDWFFTPKLGHFERENKGTR